MNVAQLPAFLVDFARTAPDSDISTRPAPPSPSPEWGKRALDGELAKTLTLEPGNRNTPLNTIAFKVGQIAGGGHVPVEDARDSFYAAALDTGHDEKKVYYMANDSNGGFEKGLENPRYPKRDNMIVNRRNTPVGRGRARELTEVRGDARVVGPSNGAHVANRSLRLVRGSETTSKAAEWAWRDDGEGRLPAGELSIVAGRGGIGKSPFTLWLASRITRGDLPGDWFGHPGDVLIYASEDSWEHTIHPRLRAAEADMSRVYFISGTGSEDNDPQTDMPLDWHSDISRVQEAVTELGARMVIIDPLMDVVGSGDSHKEQEVRRALMPLVSMARQTRAVVMGVAHFNKSRSGDVSSVLNGSAGFRNVVRSLFVCAHDEATDTYVFTQNKNNLGRTDLPSLNYQMKPVDVEIEGQPVSQPVFTFLGESEITVADAIKGDFERAERGDTSQIAIRSEAGEWLMEILKAQDVDPDLGGRGMSVKEIETAASESGFSRATLNRARAKLGTITSKSKPGDTAKNKRYWVLFEPVRTTAGGSDEVR